MNIPAWAIHERHLQEHNGTDSTLQHDTCSVQTEEHGDMHNPQAQSTNSAQYHQGERDRGPDLEAAGRGSSSGGPQGEQQGELQLREKLGERDRQERRRRSLY